MRKKANPLIFLVDDDNSFLKTIELYVRQFFHGYTVTTFTSGEECLSQLDRKPDIILLDYLLNANYPNAMDGIKVLNQVKKTNPDTYVILFSAQDHIEVAVDIMKHGAFDYIIKNDKMFLRVQNAIRNVMHIQELKRDKEDYKMKMQVLAGLAIALIGLLIYLGIFHKSVLEM